MKPDWLKGQYFIVTRHSTSYLLHWQERILKKKQPFIDVKVAVYLPQLREKPAINGAIFHVLGETLSWTVFVAVRTDKKTKEKIKNPDKKNGTLFLGV